MVGQTIVTRYNNRTYKIDDVEFKMNPDSKFALDDTEKISFADYVEKRYKVTVQNRGQPLLVSGDCYLIPELCLAIGMTERLNEQKQIFREVAMAKNADAPIKIKEAATLVKQIMSDPKCIKRMQDWRFFVDDKCVSCDGLKYDAGDIVMGQ